MIDVHSQIAAWHGMGCRMELPVAASLSGVLGAPATEHFPSTIASSIPVYTCGPEQRASKSDLKQECSS